MGLREAWGSSRWEEALDCDIRDGVAPPPAVMMDRPPERQGPRPPSTVLALSYSDHLGRGDQGP